MTTTFFVLGFHKRQLAGFHTAGSSVKKQTNWKLINLERGDIHLLKSEGDSLSWSAQLSVPEKYFYYRRSRSFVQHSAAYLSLYTLLSTSEPNQHQQYYKLPDYVFNRWVHECCFIIPKHYSAACKRQNTAFCITEYVCKCVCGCMTMASKPSRNNTVHVCVEYITKHLDWWICMCMCK